MEQCLWIRRHTIIPLLQYARCAEVCQFNDELTATEDSYSVFSTKHFAVLRFCPAYTCNGIPPEEIICASEEEYTQCGEEYCTCDEDDGDCNNYREAQGYYEENCDEYGQCSNNGGQYNGNNNNNNANGQNAQNSNWQYYNANQDNQPQNSYCNDRDTDCQETYAEGYEEEEQTWGANGPGCQNNHGEYLLDIESYMVIVVEYQ